MDRKEDKTKDTNSIPDKKENSENKNSAGSSSNTPDDTNEQPSIH